MPQFQSIKAVLNGGEMSPLMDGRTDSEKYSTGSRILENFIVKPQGGIFKRPGTRYVARAQVQAEGNILIPFRSSVEIAAPLIFHTGGISFIAGTGPTSAGAWSNATAYLKGNFVQNASVFYYCVEDHTSGGTFAPDLAAGKWVTVGPIANGLFIPLPSNDLEDLREIHFKQLNDVMFLTRKNMHPKRLTRVTSNRWVLEDVPFQFAPTIDPEVDGVTMTLVYDAADWVTLTSYSVGNFVLYLGELYRCKTANSDAAFTIAKWDKAIYLPSWNVGQSYVLGNVVEYFGSNYFCITAHTSATANRPGVGAQWVLIPITDYRIISSGSSFTTDEVNSTWLFQPGSVNRLVKETIVAGAGTNTTATVFIQGDYLVRTVWAAATAPSGVTIQLQESFDRLNFTTIKEWIVDNVQDGTISYTADAPSTGAWYRLVTIRTAGANTGTMIIEPATSRLDIPMRITSYLSATNATGVPKLAANSLIPNEVIGFAFPVWRRGAFNTTRGFPRTVAFHDQRLWFAGTATEPARMWGSQIDDFYNFQTGTLAVSAIDATLAATQANQILWIESYNRALVIGTLSEEWTMDSGEADSALTPTNLRLRRRSRYGSLGIQPTLAADALLWYDSSNRLREFAYRFESDSYVGPDMSLLAGHLLGPTPLQASYSQLPDPIVWTISSDGKLLGFSYDREQQVTAWHRHTTGEGQPLSAAFTSVCTLPAKIDSSYFGGGTTVGEEVWVIVRRNFDLDVPGSGTWFIEKMPLYASLFIAGAADSVVVAGVADGDEEFISFYLDCHSRVTRTSATGTTTTYPMTHLNGIDTVFALGTESVATDGGLITSQVSNGSPVFTFVTTSDAQSTRFVGLPYTAICMPNRLEVQLDKGTGQMSKWKITALSFRLWRSFFGNFAQRIAQIVSTNERRITTTDLTEYPSYNNPSFTIPSKWGQTLVQTTGFSFGQSADLLITSKHPMPFNVLSVTMDVEVDGTSSAPGT